MKALVIYDSKLGNTEQVAQSIADTLGEEGVGQLISVDEADVLELEGVDLLVLGGPTQRHGLSPAVRAWLELIPRGVMRGLFVAAFDTCYRMLRWKSKREEDRRDLRRPRGALRGRSEPVPPRADPARPCQCHSSGARHLRDQTIMLSKRSISSPI